MSTSSALNSGRVQQKHRTWRLLLDTAADLLSKGERPSVEAVADAAGVSRRTAYRYFPAQQKLHADAALDKLRPVMERAMGSVAEPPDIFSRIDVLIDNMQRMALENESLLRTMIHETVLSPVSSGEPSRGRRRLEWIEAALTPLRSKISAPEHRRLVSALALCTGIEALLVLRDVCGLASEEATAVSQWMGRAMVGQILRERNANRRAEAKKSKKPRRA